MSTRVNPFKGLNGLSEETQRLWYLWRRAQFRCCSVFAIAGCLAFAYPRPDKAEPVWVLIFGLMSLGVVLIYKLVKSARCFRRAATLERRRSRAR